MAMFSDKQAAAGAEAGLSIIASGMQLVGDVTADGILKVEGTVRGNLRVARQVLVARGGVVEGDIETREAIVGGEVRGQVRALERLEIQAGAVVHGDLVARVLLVQEGGEVNGVVRMGAGVEAEGVPVS
jgi:cytoskeletal protein CcmA (bactofilin family)